MMVFDTEDDQISIFKGENLDEMSIGELEDYKIQLTNKILEIDDMLDAKRQANLTARLFFHE